MEQGTIEDFKRDYNITNTDEENLRSIRDLMEKHKEDFISKFYDYILKFKDVSEYLPDESTIARHKEKVKTWFVRLFEGNYNEEYMRHLYKIGETHVKVGLPGHYVNASMNFVRRYCFRILTQEFGCSHARDAIMKSLDKLLDLNLDIMTISYREEELRIYVLPRKLEYTVIEFARRFAFLLDVLLLLALILISFFVVGEVGYEVYTVTMGTVSIETGILKILGTLLIIWAIVELLTAEIHHLKGSKFAVTVFITLAIAAVIRKILIATLSTENIFNILTLGALVMALGIVYWLMGHTESKA